MSDDKIGMNHGAGGEVMANLISKTILDNITKKSVNGGVSLDDLDDEKDLNKEVSKDIEEEKNNLLKDEDIEEKVEIEDEEQNGEDSYKLDDDNDDDEEEESIFDFYFKQPDLDERKRRMRDEKKLNADSEKKNIFKKLIGFNSKKQKEA